MGVVGRCNALVGQVEANTTHHSHWRTHRCAVTDIHTYSYKQVAKTMKSSSSITVNPAPTTTPRPRKRCRSRPPSAMDPTTTTTTISCSMWTAYDRDKEALQHHQHRVLAWITALPAMTSRCVCGGKWAVQSDANTWLRFHARSGLFLLAEDQLFRDQLLCCCSLYFHLPYRSVYKTVILTDVLVIDSSLKSFVLTTI